MLVPKAAMDKDDLFFARKDDIGAAGKVSPVESVSKTHLRDQFTDNNLGLGMARFYSRHTLAALFGREWVETQDLMICSSW